MAQLLLASPFLTYTLLGSTEDLLLSRASEAAGTALQLWVARQRWGYEQGNMR